MGNPHRSTTPRLRVRVRAELLANGGAEMQAQFMDELRETKLATQPGWHPAPRVTERLASAHASLSPD